MRQLVCAMLALAIGSCSDPPSKGAASSSATVKPPVRSERGDAQAACVGPTVADDLLRQVDREGGWPPGTLDREDECAWALTLSRVAVERYDSATARAECSADGSIGRYGSPQGWAAGRIRYVVQPIVGRGQLVELAKPLTQEDQLWWAGALAADAQSKSDCEAP